VATLQLYLLGPVDIRCGDRQLPRPPTQKSQSLLAYLVLHRSQPQSRERLAGLFFGERPEYKARRCLSTALWHINRCLPDETVLLSNSRTIQFDPRNNLWLDVEAFESHASRAEIASLQYAIALYRGDFLDGFYDDWTLSERYRLEALYLEALAQLMLHQEAGRDYQSALATSLRLLECDSLREDAHRLAMRAYCHLGQRKAALEQYARCQRTFLEELDTQPGDETLTLYQTILEGSFEIDPLPEMPQIAAHPPGPVGRNPMDVLIPVRLVGREQEMLFLENCWQRAQTGESSLVLIRGEVGIGKTRLVEEFAHRLRWQGLRLLWGRCYQFERTLPYQPLAEALRICLTALPSNELASMPAWVLKEVTRLVPEVLERPGLREARPELRRRITGVPGPELPTVSGIDPEQARLFEGVTRVLAELAAQGALLVVLEDLHWASESTLQMLHHLARYLSKQPVLIAGTYRPEAIGRRHPLTDLHRKLSREGIAQQLDLSRLSPASVATIIEEMSGAGRAVMPLAEHLYRETEGNPFFLMESIKALFETDVIQLKGGVWQGDFDRASEMELPLTASLSETVQARVQRLDENVQDALRIAAVLGREFNFEPFNEAWGKGEEATLEALEVLLRHKLVEEKFGPQDSDFAFTHHKIQEVIYQALAHHRCYYLHAQVGAALESVFAPELESKAVELAHHFERACLMDKTLSGKAIHYLLQAGQQAVRQYANQEAISYYRRGLDILQSQPETEQRLHQELELQIALSVPVMAIKGYASPETKSIFDQARNLCQKLGETPILFTSLVGLGRYYGVSGDLETGLQLAEQLLAVARTAQKPDLLLEAHRQMGGNLFSMGRLKEAREFLEAGLDLYELELHESYAYRFGHDPAATCLGYLSLTLWLQGYPEQSLVQSRKLCRLIATMTHPLSQAYAYCHLAKQACLRSAAQECLEYAEAAIHISQLHGLSSWANLAAALKGWALFEQGQMTEGMALLTENTRAWRAKGYTHFTPFLLALQAVACLKMRKLKAGTEVVRDALEISLCSGDVYWMAELYRLQAELLWAGGGDDGSVETNFQKAIETAQQQGARMLELRAATSLARLWQQQGKSQAAKQMLAEVYDGFSEGFATCELKTTSALLQEFS
jgi:predicted ATPase/DNA-binding SARP family transcriptional activator